MFDEQPDGDLHGECAAEIHRLEIALKIKTEEHDCCAEDLLSMRNLMGQCYAKLLKFGVEKSDPLLMDELKLTLMDEPPYQNAVQAAFDGIGHATHG